MTEKDKIKTWLTTNLKKRVAGNKYLMPDEIESVSAGLSKIISDIDGSDDEDSIAKGNALLMSMNKMMNINRMKEVITLDEYITKIEATREDNQDLCAELMEMFDTMLGCQEYDKVIEYINATNLDNVTISGVPMWILIDTNPIVPLLRPIPPKEDIEMLSVCRFKFYEKSVEFYKRIGKGEDYVRMPSKPENYDKAVASYDQLYFFGAPKVVKVSVNELVIKAVDTYPEKAAEYRDGNTALLGLFVGEVMKLSRGLADPEEATNKIKEVLDGQQ